MQLTLPIVACRCGETDVIENDGPPVCRPCIAAAVRLVLEDEAAVLERLRKYTVPA